jgi:hypothetical protein
MLSTIISCIAFLGTVGLLLIKGGKLLKRFEDIAEQFEKYPPMLQDMRLSELEQEVFGRKKPIGFTNGAHKEETE